MTTQPTNGGDIVEFPRWEPTDADAPPEFTVEDAYDAWQEVERSDLMERTGVRSLSLFSTDPPPPLIIERLDPAGHTILYGPGGAGKGVTSAYWILQLARLGRRVLIIDYEQHPEEWARRVYGLGGADLMAAGLIHYVAPLSRDWHARRGPIWVQQDELREIVVALAIDNTVIDSLAFACLGFDVSDAETPQLYGAALEIIGSMPLSLAHVPKDGNLRYPFGSVFWHNGARTTWSQEENGTKRILMHRKHNNYPKQPKRQIEVTWLDGRPTEVWERPYHEVLADRIARVLGGGVKTSKVIVDELNADLEEDEKPVTPDTVGRTLRRGAGSLLPRFRKEGADAWSLT